MVVRGVLNAWVLLSLAACGSDVAFYSTPTHVPVNPLLTQGEGENAPEDNSGNGNAAPKNAGECGVAAFTQKTAQDKKLDILIMVDTSGSMSDELQKVGDQFESFVSALHSKHTTLDFQIVVMLAHSNSANAGWFWKPTGCTNPNIIKGNALSDFDQDIKPALQCKLRNFTNEGDSFGGGEAGFLSTLKALGTNWAAIRAEGFFRSDAALAVIYVSDENEVCNLPMGINETQSYERNLRTSTTCQNVTADRVYRELRNVKGNVPLTIAAMVNKDLPATSKDYGWGYYSDPNNGVNFPGIVNIAGTNGIATDIDRNSSQIAMDLATIGDRVAVNLQKLTSFKLPNGTVAKINWVKVSSKEVPFEWADAAQEMRLGWADAGNNGDSILVNYCLK